jgi:hypothetical protein
MIMFKITGNYYSNCCHSVIMNNDSHLNDWQIIVLVFRSLPAIARVHFCMGSCMPTITLVLSASKS